MADSYIEHRYLTDDRDVRDRKELIIGWSANGDYYISIAPEGQATAGKAVRICTSGGASSRNPKLVRAVSDMFQALGGWGETVSDGR